MSYQNFQSYNGSLYGTPQYKGIEYDWEVPDNMVVASPGGVSTTQHHYTKGLYGQPNSHWDVYGGEAQRYPYAEHGGLYTVGHNAPEKMHEYSMKPFDMMYTENDTLAQIDNFVPGAEGSMDTTPIDDYHIGKSKKKASSKKKQVEFIAPPDTTEVSSKFKSLKNIIKVPNPWFVFFIILMAYIALSLWSNAGQSFIFDKFHGGRKPGYQWLALYALIFTGLTFLVTQLFGIPLISIEMDEI